MKKKKKLLIQDRLSIFPQMVCFSSLSSSRMDEENQTAYWLSSLGQVKGCSAQAS